MVGSPTPAMIPAVATSSPSSVANIAALAAFDPQMRGANWLKSPTTTVGVAGSCPRSTASSPRQNATCSDHIGARSARPTGDAAWCGAQIPTTRTTPSGVSVTPDKHAPASVRDRPDVAFTRPRNQRRVTLARDAVHEPVGPRTGEQAIPGARQREDLPLAQANPGTDALPFG